MIIPVSVKPDLIEYCNQIKKQFLSNNIKWTEIDDSSDTLQKKIANSEVLHWNYIIVIGKKELSNNTINVRGLGELSIKDFVNKLV